MAERSKITTIRDLQTFIDAVEFASDQEEWVPSAKQWRRIREMIDQLEEPPTQTAQPPAPVYVQQAHPPMPPSFAAPSAFGGMPANMPSGYPTGVPNTGLFAQGPVPVRTPDVDTSGGKSYQSSFA